MEQMSYTLNDLIEANQDLDMVYQPLFFRLNNPEDREQFYTVLTLPGIQVSNELHGQLMELVKLKFPKKKFQKEELSAAATEYLGNTPDEEYGVWVYYPWLNKMVHLLDEEEYIILRTNRNQYKITPEERDVMATQKLGVLGLSVGQAVAVTLAMERSFGELRIADFDILELSNLNRIRSGTQDLGLLKTVSTARQIAEIDPFLKVVCFHDGLTEENIDAFFTGGGKLDIVIDECDGLDIKILARLKARELGVPVVMETSDRGMIDIERFDLEPDRPIMHGLIEHLDQNPQNLKGLSNEEKIPYILPMLGLDTMSDRLKASMLEVEQSITTWPQLASDVILGGAASANVIRRMCLDQFNRSGRFFVDLNEVVSEDRAHQFQLIEEEVYIEESYIVTLQLGARTMMELPGQLALGQEQVETLVEAAIWAPSGGNSQPWKWVYENRSLFLLLDRSRATSFLDFEAAGAYLGLGAATENLVLKAHEMGLEVQISQFPEKGMDDLAAQFRFFEAAPTGTTVAGHDLDNLTPGIRTRLTNRLLRKRQPLSPQQLSDVKAIGQTIPGASIELLSDPGKMEKIGQLIAKSDRILITHKDGHHGFVTEIRWSDKEAAEKKDGVDIATIDLSAGEAAGFRMARNWSVVKTLNQWGGGGVFEKLSNKCIAGASAVGLITMPGPESADYYNAGRAMERLWLYSNLHGIALQPMTGLTFMLHRLIHGNGVDLTPENVEQLSHIREEFYETFGLDSQVHPAFLFRLLVADEPKVKSQRRLVDDVLIYNG